MRFIFSLIFLFPLISAGQGNKYQDSLFTIWKDTGKPDSVQLQALHDLIWSLTKTDPDSAFRLAEVQMELARKSGSVLLKARALNNMGVSFYTRGDLKTALPYFEEGLEVISTTTDTFRIAIGHHNLAMQYQALSRDEKALKHLNISLALFKSIRNFGWIGNVYNQLGGHWYNTGDNDKAHICFLKAVEHTRLGKEVSGEANAFTNLALLMKRKGETEKSIQYSEKALELYKKQKNFAAISNAYSNMSNTYGDIGDYKKATEVLIKSLAIAESNAQHRLLPYILINLGLMYSEQGDYAEARKNLQKAITLSTEQGNLATEALATSNLGVSYELTGDYKRAEEYGSLALSLYTKAADPDGIARANGNLGVILMKQGKYKEALQHEIKALEIYQGTGNKPGIINILVHLGDIALETGDVSSAISYGRKGLDLSTETGKIDSRRDHAQLLYKAYKKSQNHKDALQMYELFTGLSDSLVNEENRTNLIRTQLQYNYDKKAIEDSVRHANMQQVADATISAQQAKLETEALQRNGLFGGLAALLIFSGFIFNRFRVTRKQKFIIEGQKQEVEIQKTAAEAARHEAEEKHREVTDSIRYAKRLQSAILPSIEFMQSILPASFILFKPKDIVSGDFYWAERIGSKVFFAVADCTGHGVPGAMVSVVGVNSLKRIVREFNITSPAAILDKLNELVEETFSKSADEVRDGMDIALCSIDMSTGTLSFAGANNPLYLLADGTLDEIKGDKQPIGKYSDRKPFTNHEFPLKPDTCIYLFSDGFADQFGGPLGKKFKYKPFKDLIVSHSHQHPESQAKALENAINDWKGELEQVDDICVMGVRYSPEMD